jgi:hypothetical protein
MFRSAALRPVLATAPRARTQVRFATQDYGSGQGDPAGEKPQEQGKNSREDLEHPGPPPPKVAQGKNQQSTSSSQSQSEGSTSSGGKTSQSGGSSGSNRGTKGAQPKILNENPPSEGEQDESVKQHNKDMDKRAERAHQQVSNKDAFKDKVPSKFWSGKSLPLSSIRMQVHAANRYGNRTRRSRLGTVSDAKMAFCA